MSLLEKGWGGLKPLGFALRVDLAEGYQRTSAEVQVLHSRFTDLRV